MSRLRARAAGIALCAWLCACAGQAPLAPLPRLGAEPASAPPQLLAASASPPALPALGSFDSPSESGSMPGSLPAVSQGDIGGEGPVRLLAASASGAWVALCDGAPQTPKLVLGSGAGELIDDVLAHERSGRYVVVLQAGRAILIDTADGSRVDLSGLGADLRRLRADYAGHRSLSFDAGGKYLAYFRSAGSPKAIVVRELASGGERAFPLGPGDLLSLRLSADARHVSFEALREDTNHNGKLDWPAPEESRRPSVCDEPLLPKLRSFGYQGRGDAIVRGVANLETGALRDVPGLLTPLGPSLLLRAADGSLQLERAGKLRQIAPPSCAGRVLFADAERELVVATCSPPPPKKVRRRPLPPPTGKREVWLFGAGYAKNLQSELYETSVDREAVVGARLVPIYPGSGASLLDLEQRELLPLPPGSRVLTTSGARAVVWQGSELYRYDAQSRRLEQLCRGVLKNPELLQAGASILLSPFVIVDAAPPVLTSPGRALALTRTGMVLVPKAEVPAAGAARGAIEGPLHWLDARLPPPDGPPR